MNYHTQQKSNFRMKLHQASDEQMHHAFMNSYKLLVKGYEEQDLIDEIKDNNITDCQMLPDKLDFNDPDFDPKVLLFFAHDVFKDTLDWDEMMFIIDYFEEINDYEKCAELKKLFDGKL